MTSRLTFHGATRTVTGSCFLLETEEARLLVDCGLYQGPKMEERNRQPFPFEPASITAVLLTHAHIDHSGMLPRLARDGFAGPVYTHPATADLARVLLPDSGHIQEMTQGWANKKRRRRGLEPLDPIYTSADAEAALPRLTGVPYRQTLRLPGTSIDVTFRDAGHILGSAFIEVVFGPDRKREKIVFSGDLGNPPTPILNDPDALSEADYVLIESTYGHRTHEDRSERGKLLAEIVASTVKRGGNLVIPSFSVERTQELLYNLDELQRTNAIPMVPIYIDSPMAISATEIFRKHPECYDRELSAKIARGEDPFAPANLRLTRTADQSRAINAAQGPAIVISANGMCTAGRILHHLRHNLWRQDSTVLFVGFQGEGTLGRAIRDGVRHVTIMGERVNVRARIASIGGFSAHADQGGLGRWLFGQGRAPHRAFVVHGEVKSAFAFQQFIDARWPGAGYVPSYGQSVALTAEEVKRLSLPSAPRALESVRGFKAHDLEVAQRAKALAGQLGDFLSAAKSWAADQPDHAAGSSGSLDAVRSVLGRIGEMACESATACNDVLSRLDAASGARREQEMVDQLGKLGEKLGRLGPGR